MHVTPSEEYLHEGHQGEVTHRGGVVTSPNPPPAPSVTIQLEVKNGEEDKSLPGGDKKEGVKLPGQEEDKILGCQYKRGGWCLKHGDGAKRYYKT